MQLPVYAIGQLIVILLAAGLVSSIYVGLNKTLRRVKTPPWKRERLLQSTLALLLGWLLFLAILPILEVLQPEGNNTEMMLSLFFIPTAGFILFSFAPSLRNLLLFIDGRWLIRIQGFRIITELLFWMGFKAGFIPMQMTFHWLNYDIIVGLSALLGSQVFFVRGPRRLEIIIWNTFGIISALYLIIIALTSLPDPQWQLFQTHVDGRFLLEVPFIWLVGFVYPLAIAVHVCSVQQLFLRPGRQKEIFQRLAKRMRKE